MPRAATIQNYSYSNSSASIAGWGAGGYFEIELLEQRPGLLIFRASGPGAGTAFRQEPGGHRFQRIPITEKRGRVQTSTITVAVLREPEESEFRMNLADVDIQTTRGSGPGGQNRNKTESCVVATHRPSGFTVRIDTERSQGQNKRLAYGLLRAKLLERQQNEKLGVEQATRRSQLGSGQRGDKVRTIAITRDQVVDHKSGAKTTYVKYYKGQFDGIW